MFDRQLFEFLNRSRAALPPVFPLPVLNGDPPVVLVFDPTDYGIEIAYEKTPSHEVTRVRPTTRETTLYNIPRLVPVFVVTGGTVVEARDDEDGFLVLVEHRNGWLTLYSRLTHMFVRATDQAPRVNTKIETGDILGYVGPQRAGPLRPLRFEMWRRNEDRDPEPVDAIGYLHRWQLTRWNDARVKPVESPSQHIT